MKILEWLKKSFTRKSEYLERQEKIRAAEVKVELQFDAGETLKQLDKIRDRLRVKPVTVDPIPMKYGRFLTPTEIDKYQQVFTWEGEPLTDTQYGYRPAPDLWQARTPGLPVVLDGMKVFEKHTIEEWNDMTEASRQQLADEWQKVHSLGAIGIAAPEPDAEARAVERMQRRAVANNLARELEAHKRKLERELEEAAEQEKLYEGNTNFGAF